MPTPTPSLAQSLPIVHLCEVPQARAAVAAMIHAEFWADVPGASADGMAARLALAATSDRLPLCRVAMAGEVPVAVANLIDFDDPNPRIGRPWLAGLVVAPAWRGSGLGSRLVRAVLDDARRLGERTLFLGTDGPGFYTRLGAQVQQQLRPDFWLLRFDLGAAQTAAPAPLRPQVEVFIATSLDGFIARPDGGLDWLMQAQAGAPPGEDFGYAAFMAGVDALVMGRKSYDTVLGFDPWPYGPTPVHVLTRQPTLAVPEALRTTVQVHHGPPAALLARLAAQGLRRVYLDGGELIQTCLAEDLVDRFTLTTVPVLLGQGRRLWGALPADRGWTLEAVQHWPACGFVQTRYRCR